GVEHRSAVSGLDEFERVLCGARSALNVSEFEGRKQTQLLPSHEQFQNGFRFGYGLHRSFSQAVPSRFRKEGLTAPWHWHSGTMHCRSRSESCIQSFTELFRRRDPQVAHLAWMQFEHLGDLRLRQLEVIVHLEHGAFQVAQGGDLLMELR